MQYYLWVFINLLFILGSGVYIWLFSKHDSTIVMYGQLLSQLAILLFILNVNMYFIILLIKKVKSKKIKISLAKISRKLMRLHIPIALAGTILIIVHAVIMLTQMIPQVGLTHPKLVSGFGAIVFLSFTLFAGYLRHVRASGFRRKFHIATAFAFAISFTIHLFIPLT